MSEINWLDDAEHYFIVNDVFPCTMRWMEKFAAAVRLAEHDVKEAMNDLHEEPREVCMSTLQHLLERLRSGEVEEK